MFLSQSRCFCSSATRTTIFSGIQPTGVMHLGNYFGAITNWVKYQNDQSNDCIYSIVDLHAITLPQDPQELRTSVRRMTATLLSCGIDPNKSLLFQQSSVPHHGQFAWILGTLSTLPKLSGLPQFKEKSEGLKIVPLGLLSYPVLQTADILLYRASLIPVGEDNLQQIYFAQHLTQKFNSRFKTKFFPWPKPLLNSGEGSRIKSLRDPSKKMSKSDPIILSRIELLDPPELILKKIKKSITDFSSHISYDPQARPGVSNLVLIDSLISDKTVEQIVESSGSVNTEQYKLQLAEKLIEFLKPIRHETLEILEDETELDKILDSGSVIANQRAEETMNEVRKLLGFQ